MPLECRPARGAEDLAIPPYAPRYLFRRLHDGGGRAKEAVNEILVSLQGSGLKPQIHCGIARSKHAVDGATRRRRFEVVRINRQNVGIVTIAEFPGRAYWLMPFRQLFGSLPHGIRGDFEVLEGAAPGFHCVCNDSRVPVQLVDGEVSMLDRWQNPRELHILHMRDSPEFQTVESHGHSPGHPAVESSPKKVRNSEPALADLIEPRPGRP